jgi:hypothetical protein
MLRLPNLVISGFTMDRDGYTTIATNYFLSFFFLEIGGVENGSIRAASVNRDVGL